MPGPSPLEWLRARPSPLAIGSLACCALGTWLRLDYALGHHHLRHRASSDALLYLERAQELLHSGALPSLPATIWPPGTSALWAVLSALDPSQQLSAAWNAGASLLVMPLTAAVAGLLAGSRAAWIALALAALHPGFIHYAGFALAEQPFQLAIAVALYLTIAALVRLEAEPEVAERHVVARPRSLRPAANTAQAGAAPAANTATTATAAGPATLETVTATIIAGPRPVSVYPPPEPPGFAPHKRGRLAPPSPGGGSAQGKWFGRFQTTPESDDHDNERSAPRTGFLRRGKAGAGPSTPAGAASSAARSAFSGRTNPVVEPALPNSPAANLASASNSNSPSSAATELPNSANPNSPSSTTLPDSANSNPPNSTAANLPSSATPSDSQTTATSTAPAAPRTSPLALAGTANLWLAGAAVGCSWGLAALIRPNALPVAVFGALALWVCSRPLLPSRAAWVGLGAALASCVVLAAAAGRCTATAKGRFCLVSNNLAMNVALGQAGPVIGLEFKDPEHPELASGWVPPSLLAHGYQGMGQVPASVYDTSRIYGWVADRFAEDPIAYGVRAVGNALDLFNLGYWPDEFGRYPERSATVLRQAWSAAVFVPALFALIALARRAFRPRTCRPAAVFVLGALVGLTLSAALSLGEARYRIPFDGLWLGLASATYARANDWAAVSFIAADRLAARHWLLWTQLLALTVALVIGLTHPALNLGLLLPQHGAALLSRTTGESMPAANFSTPRASGADWNGPGNYVWRCNPDCGELRLSFEAPRRARRLQISVDHNDRYRLLFYRGATLRAHVDVPPALGIPTGLQSATIDIPAAARSGFDAIGIQPLYGDGGYSLGHVLPE